MSLQKLSNPRKGCFGFGISAKIGGWFPWSNKTFYGINSGSCYLDGKLHGGAQGPYNGNIRKWRDLNHFKIKMGEVDMYLDVDKGIFKLCVVGALNEKKEVIINGLHESGNERGWVPHLLFNANDRAQHVRVGSIDSICYGMKMDIKWE